MSHVIFGRTYPEQADAIVIGSGVGGLICANLLAKGGMKVLLLERHYMLGGYCSTFRRRGFVFDAATHFYPLLGNPTTLTGKLLRQLDIPTQWIKMDPVDRFHFPSAPPFAVPADFKEYLGKLKQRFPGQAAELGAYFSELRRAYLCGLLYYFKGVETERARRFENYTVTQKLDEHFSDPRLKALLLADAAHWGSLPSRTSYLFDAMLRFAYFLGNYYPRGGSQRFVDDLGRALEARGGKVLRCASTEKIIVVKGGVEGVRVQTVSKRPSEQFTFRAPLVVSNADAIHTYRDLIGAGHCGRELISRLESLRPSYPCFLVHIGLRGMDPQKLAAAEGYHWSSHDPGDVVKNVFKVFIPTRFDPAVAPPGCQILIVQKLEPARIEEVDDWAAHKASVEGKIMERLRDLIPGIDARIVVKLSATAMTSFKYTRNWQGAMLGWEMSPDQLGAARLPTSTPIKGLHLVGHWAQPGGGITPVMICAQRVAEEILSGGQRRDEFADWRDRFRPADSFGEPRGPEV